MTGTATFSSKAPVVPAKATAASLPTTWATTCTTISGMTGLTLPGMIELPGWRSGRWISASPAAGPLRHPPQVVGHLDHRDGHRAHHPGRLDQGVPPPLGLEVVAGLHQRQPGPSASRAMTAAANPAGALIPVPTAVPPRASSPSRGSEDASRSIPISTAVA